MPWSINFPSLFQDQPMTVSPTIGPQLQSAKNVGMKLPASVALGVMTALIKTDMHKDFWNEVIKPCSCAWVGTDIWLFLGCVLHVLCNNFILSSWN